MDDGCVGSCWCWLVGNLISTYTVRRQIDEWWCGLARGGCGGVRLSIRNRSWSLNQSIAYLQHRRDLKSYCQLPTSTFNAYPRSTPLLNRIGRNTSHPQTWRSKTQTRPSSTLTNCPHGGVNPPTSSPRKKDPASSRSSRLPRTRPCRFTLMAKSRFPMRRMSWPRSRLMSRRFTVRHIAPSPPTASRLQPHFNLNVVVK